MKALHCLRIDVAVKGALQCFIENKLMCQSHRTYCKSCMLPPSLVALSSEYFNQILRLGPAIFVCLVMFLVPSWYYCKATNALQNYFQKKRSVEQMS